MSENFYNELRDRDTDTAQMDLDGIASCIRAITTNLDALHKDKNLAVTFSKLTQQMQGHLDRLREKRFNAYEFFSGQGTVARKLREHVKMDDWLNPSHRARNSDARRNIDLCFNKYPTRDEMELKELSDFIELTIPLMSGAIDGVDWQEVENTVPITSLETGFYAMKYPSGQVKARMILKAVLPTSRIGVLYVLENEAAPQLIFHHPEENEWFRADLSFTFPSVTSYLKSELDALIKPLGFTVDAGDLNEQLEEVFQKVDYVFDQQHRLPTSGLQFVHHEKDLTQITIPIGDHYRWRFDDTRGQWPSRSKKFLILVGSTIQAARPEDMNEFSRQNMVKSLHIVFDNILGALVPETETEAS
jgi:hypothetical protein